MAQRKPDVGKLPENEEKSAENSNDISHLPRGAIGMKGIPVSRNTRLPSIRSPRDLTLGAVPKRIYAPKIPVRREKKVAVIDEGAKVCENDKKSNITKRGRNRGRGRGRGGAALIQTHGSVFSEGFAELPKKERNKEPRQRHNVPKSSKMSKKSQMVLKSEKVDSSELDESTILENLLRENFIDDDDDEANSCLPIVIPIKNVFNATNENDQKKDKKDTVVKSESLGDVTGINLHMPNKGKIKNKERGITRENENINKPTSMMPNFLNSHLNDPGKFILFQFPDTLCVPEKPKGPSRPLVTKDNDQLPPKTGLKLADLQNGYMGKLQILKSGKCRLVFNGTVFDLQEGTNVSFAQELVSIKTSAGKGDMTVLGQVPTKIKCIPNVENLKQKTS